MQKSKEAFKENQMPDRLALFLLSMREDLLCRSVEGEKNLTRSASNRQHLFPASPISGAVQAP